MHDNTNKPKYKLLNYVTIIHKQTNNPSQNNKTTTKQQTKKQNKTAQIEDAYTNKPTSKFKKKKKKFLTHHNKHQNKYMKIYDMLINNPSFLENYCLVFMCLLFQNESPLNWNLQLAYRDLTVASYLREKLYLEYAPLIFLSGRLILSWR